ncbi:hypothetical protein A3Q56_00410 [Intoshia linei]|uniref:PID domain-containing protein n=1 Tax=Intoshia linei TaxID=1819745 RepID=A0A177BDW2_9BILA|nr:hypothetical protein A3Q56_00410 [Intoshia linei]
MSASKKDLIIYEKKIEILDYKTKKIEELIDIEDVSFACQYLEVKKIFSFIASDKFGQHRCFVLRTKQTKKIAKSIDQVFNNLKYDGEKDVKEEIQCLEPTKIETPKITQKNLEICEALKVIDYFDRHSNHFELNKVNDVMDVYILELEKYIPLANLVTTRRKYILEMEQLVSFEKVAALREKYDITNGAQNYMPASYSKRSCDARGSEQILLQIDDMDTVTHTKSYNPLDIDKKNSLQSISPLNHNSHKSSNTSDCCKKETESDDLDPSDIFNVFGHHEDSLIYLHHDEVYQFDPIYTK